MNEARSADGTPIAFERLGAGAPVILVGGALANRDTLRPTAEALAQQFTVFVFDRRGRGDSGDTLPYAVEREVEDIGALITEAGGKASVYGHSSGAGLALHAAARGLPIDRLVLHEPPYGSDREEDRRGAREYAEEVRALLAAGRPGDALALFMTVTGAPPEAVDKWRTEPWWAPLEAHAHTLAYDSAVMGDLDGGTVPIDLVASVAVPTLVICGEESYEGMVDVGREVADTLPNARQQILPGQGHNVPAEVLAPVLVEFLGG
ncbi:MAG TPA: alpha/beta hydrolase [Pilimelia sp.]|nr:alpha/beta hydrolase [Pilimelia sp.]